MQRTPDDTDVAAEVGAGEKMAAERDAAFEAVAEAVEEPTAAPCASPQPSFERLARPDNRPCVGISWYLLVCLGYFGD